MVSGPASTGRFFSSASTEQVAMWSAPTIDGAWKASTLVPNPGRDGPNETIEYIATSAGRAFAFGWRNSPTEGYPRPSPWIQSPVPDGSWREVLEPREFFGGPNIIAFGGAAVGPDGYFVAGTWTGTSGRTVASVWSSADGQAWARDSTDPSFEGRPGEIPYGTGVSDSNLGVVLIGTDDLPSHQDPTARQGAIWMSAHGTGWRRVFTSVIAQRWPESTFDSVVSTPRGWLVAGTIGAAGAAGSSGGAAGAAGSSGGAAVWAIDPSGRTIGVTRLPSPPGSVTVTGMAADGSRLVVAGVSDGEAVLWTASLRDGRPAGWRRLDAPTGSGLERVVVSIGSSGTIVSLLTNVESQVWTTTWH